jgi:hypothetical protein
MNDEWFMNVHRHCHFQPLPLPLPLKRIATEKDSHCHCHCHFQPLPVSHTATVKAQPLSHTDTHCHCVTAADTFKIQSLPLPLFFPFPSIFDRFSPKFRQLLAQKSLEMAVFFHVSPLFCIFSSFSSQNFVQNRSGLLIFCSIFSFFRPCFRQTSHVLLSSEIMRTLAATIIPFFPSPTHRFLQFPPPFAHFFAAKTSHAGIWTPESPFWTPF